jgi:hypothetical protein
MTSEPPLPGQTDDIPTAPAEPPLPGQTDDKDWTWVLDRPCPDCAADVGALTIGEVAALNRNNAAEWATLLASDTSVTERPNPDVWSPLEYGAHVRDVFRLFLTRLELMLEEDDPMFANWNPNETAEADRYDLQDPASVAAELTEAANRLADRFESLSSEQLERPGRRSDGAEFSVLSFARYEVHDPMHHLWDVKR